MAILMSLVLFLRFNMGRARAQRNPVQHGSDYIRGMRHVRQDL
jgi:hypothetical protein